MLYERCMKKTALQPESYDVEGFAAVASKHMKLYIIHCLDCSLFLNRENNLKTLPEAYKRNRVYLTFEYWLLSIC